MGDKKTFIKDIERALLASKLVSYAQGYVLMSSAAKEYNWNLNYVAIALMWSGGCIIHSVFIDKVKEAFDNIPGLTNLLFDPYFSKRLFLLNKAGGIWLPLPL